jgi:hypothetical protein
MNGDAPHVSRERHTLGYVGAVLLLLIIPVKLLRYSSAAGSMAVGVAQACWVLPAYFSFCSLIRAGCHG